MFCNRLLFFALVALILTSCGGGSSESTIDSVTPVEPDIEIVDESNTNPSGPEIQNPMVDTDNEVESTPSTDQTADTTSPVEQDTNGVIATGNAGFEFAGLLQVSDSMPQRTTQFVGGFYRLSELEERFPGTLDFLQNVDELANTDSCNVTAISGFPPTISAGEVIPVTGNTGTVASLTRVQNTSNFVDYSDIIGPLDPVANLRFDIPGDEFPAFTNIQVPNSIPLLGISPSLNSTVTANTVFRWAPGMTGVTHMSIGITFGAGSTNSVHVGCFIVDDGEFSIPQNLRNEIGDAVATRWNLDRRHFITIQNQSAIIQVQRYFLP